MNSHRAISTFFLLATLASISTVTGCFSIVDIEGRDQNALVPVGRASIQLYPQHKPTFLDVGRSDAIAEHYQLWPERKGIDGSLSLDFEVAGTRGDFAQSLGSGEAIYFEDTIFNNSPVLTQFDLTAGSVAARGGVVLKEIVSLEAIAGVGVQNFELELASGGNRAYDAQLTAGPLLGARGGFHLFRWLAIYAQANMSFGVGDDLSTLGTLETGAEISPLPGVSLIVGYRWWEYEQERDDGAGIFNVPGLLEESDIDIESAGPLVGLKLTF